MFKLFKRTTNMIAGTVPTSVDDDNDEPESVITVSPLRKYKVLARSNGENQGALEQIVVAAAYKLYADEGRTRVKFYNSHTITKYLIDEDYDEFRPTHTYRDLVLDVIAPVIFVCALPD